MAEAALVLAPLDVLENEISGCAFYGSKKQNMSQSPHFLKRIPRVIPVFSSFAME